MLRERGLQRGGLKGELVARLAEHTPDNDDEMVTPADAAAGASRAAARNAANATRTAANHDKTKDIEKNLKIKIEELFAARKARKEWGAKKKQNQTEGVDEVALSHPDGGVCTTTSNHPIIVL